MSVENSFKIELKEIPEIPEIQSHELYYYKARVVILQKDEKEPDILYGKEVIHFFSLKVHENPVLILIDDVLKYLLQAKYPNTTSIIVSDFTPKRQQNLPTVDHIVYMSKSQSSNISYCTN